MARVRVYVPDIECDSCIKVIKRKFKRLKGVETFSPSMDFIEVEYNEEETSPTVFVNAVKQAGFRASLDPFERKTFGERWRDWKENKKKYAVERRMLAYAGLAFVILSILWLIAYGALRHIPDFLPKYGWWAFYLTISVAAIGAVIWHFYSYRTKVTCMVGMMIGMTVGMQTGMMIGAIIGATNGFFTGAMVGMLLGSAVGALTGRCCGIMGVMEGLMAGVMGGTMGPMISVMMLTDRLLLFMPFYVAINLIILAGMAYMHFEESVEHKRVEVLQHGFLIFISCCVLATGLLALIMLFGPKAPAFI